MTLQDRLRSDPYAVSHGLRYEAADALDALTAALATERNLRQQAQHERDAMLEQLVAKEAAAQSALQDAWAERDQWKARCERYREVLVLVVKNPKILKVARDLSPMTEEIFSVVDDAMKEQP